MALSPSIVFSGSGTTSIIEVGFSSIARGNPRPGAVKTTSV